MTLLREIAGHKIRATRQRQGIKQGDLADLLGIHWTNLSRIENGHSSIGLDRLEQIAAILGTSGHHLLCPEQQA